MYIYKYLHTISGLVYLCITTCKIDFAKLRAHYYTILHLMPDDYELTVGNLQDYFSDDQIADILSNSTSTIANKIILDCLIERINCREELLDLCDQLEKITNSNNMRVVINEIRLGQYCCYFIICDWACNNQPC